MLQIQSYIFLSGKLQNIRKLYFWLFNLIESAMKQLKTGGLLEDIKINLRYSDWNGGLPFQWNETLNILEKKTPKELRKLGIRLGIATLYYILALIQFFRVFSKSSLMVITHSILMLAGIVMILSSQFVNFLQLSGVVQLCNGFIQLEHNFSKHFGNNKSAHEHKSQSTELILRLLIYLLTLTAIIVPIVFFLDILRNPCLPGYVGYWISSQCEINKPGYYLMPTWSFMEILTKVAISLAACFTWSPLICGAFFQFSLEYIMEGNCFRVDIEKLGK